jgi:hypothetical protein
MPDRNLFWSPRFVVRSGVYETLGYLGQFNVSHFSCDVLDSDTLRLSEVSEVWLIPMNTPCLEATTTNIADFNKRIGNPKLLIWEGIQGEITGSVPYATFQNELSGTDLRVITVEQFMGTPAEKYLLESPSHRLVVNITTAPNRWAEFYRSPLYVGTFRFALGGWACCNWMLVTKRLLDLFATMYVTQSDTRTQTTTKRPSISLAVVSSSQFVIFALQLVANAMRTINLIVDCGGKATGTFSFAGALVLTYFPIILDTLSSSLLALIWSDVADGKRLGIA